MERNASFTSTRGKRMRRIWQPGWFQEIHPLLAPAICHNSNAIGTERLCPICWRSKQASVSWIDRNNRPNCQKVTTKPDFIVHFCLTWIRSKETWFEAGEAVDGSSMKWLLIFCGCVASVSPSTFFNLTILHTNDIHSRFQEANVYGDRCSEQQSSWGQCYGGFPRLVYQTRQIRQREPNSIYVDAGDLFQGTVWYTIHRWRAAAHFANLLNLTAMVIALLTITYRYKFRVRSWKLTSVVIGFSNWNGN